MNQQGIKARELRIGNWIADSENEFEITGFDTKKNRIYHVYGFSDIEGCFPIPLSDSSEQWLIRLGLETDLITYWKEYFIRDKKYYFELGRFADDSFRHLPTGSISVHGVDVKYVHELQNLFFALTGTELELQQQKS